MDTFTFLRITAQVLFFLNLCNSSTWLEWWTYEGISGPDFWGVVNPEWYICTKGKRQSPINIDPKQLLFDSTLRNIRLDKERVSGYLVNTGHDIRLLIEETLPSQYANISMGPLAYQYRVSEISIHFGANDKIGSEHTINSVSFPAEIQIIAYNSELYGNMTQATYSTNGLTIIALLVQVGKKTNSELDSIIQHLKSIKFKGQQVRLRQLLLYGLLPQTDFYMTYEGSITKPGCYETVTWLIFNKPIYISEEDLKTVRTVMQGEPGNPKMSMANNIRPPQHVHQRPVRTNINFKNTKQCNMEKQVFYQANISEKN